MTEIKKIQNRLRHLAYERDWDQFHSPKNLSMALISEAAELVEHFQWLTEEQSASLNKEKLEEVVAEMADIQIYLIRLADKLNVDLFDAVNKKFAGNEKKQPVKEVKGNEEKHYEYE